MIHRPKSRCTIRQFLMSLAFTIRWSSTAFYGGTYLSHAFTTTVTNLTVFPAGADTVKTLLVMGDVYTDNHVEHQCAQDILPRHGRVSRRPKEGARQGVLSFYLNTDLNWTFLDELDAVVGNNRLPTFSDRPNLPYIDALIKEVLRWKPVLPIGK